MNLIFLIFILFNMVLIILVLHWITKVKELDSLFRFQFSRYKEYHETLKRVGDKLQETFETHSTINFNINSLRGRIAPLEESVNEIRKEKIKKKA